MRYPFLLLVTFFVCALVRPADARPYALSDSSTVETGDVEGTTYVGITRPKGAEPLGTSYWNTSGKEQFGDAQWIARTGIIMYLFVVKDATLNRVCGMTVNLYRSVTGSRYLLKTFDVGDIAYDQYYLYGGLNVSSLPGPTPAVGDTVLLEWEATFSDWANLCIRTITSRYYNRVTIGQPLPSLANWYRTDTHYHTRFTDNLFEFGGYVPMVCRSAEMVGLDVVCITDHSTDIRTTSDAFGWNQLIAEADSLSGISLVLLIPGEELTLDTNESNETVDDRIHLLAIGLTRPLLAPELCCTENWSTQLWTLRQGLDSVAVQNAVALAAHPSSTFSVGDFGGELAYWSTTNFDIASTYGQFIGSEFYNERSTVLNRSIPNENLVYGYDWTANPSWEDPWNEGLGDFFALVRRNLGPVRPFALAGGSDAHGDFSRKYSNRYGVFSPFVNDDAIGKVHTLVYSPSGRNRDGVLAGIRNRQMVMTDGPTFTVWVDTNGDGTVEGTVGAQYAFGANAKVRLEGGSLAGEHGVFTEARFYLVTPTAVETTTVALSGTALNTTLSASQYEKPGTWSALIINVRTAKGYQATTSPIYVAPQGTTDIGQSSVRLQFTGPRPNPSVGQATFTISVPSSTRGTVDVFDLSGRQVTHHDLGVLMPGTTTFTWDTRGLRLPTGVYHARFATDDASITRKVVLVR